MKVIAFNRSPRKEGNTFAILNMVLDEIKKEGIETEIYTMAGKPIQGCIACYQCMKNKNGKCAVEKDIANECIAKMREADGVILGTPTYFSDVTAGMKALIERAGLVARANDYFLLSAGYRNTKKVKLSGSFVTNKLNIDEIETLWRFCRDRNIFPNMEIMTPNGRARNHLDWIPNRKEIMDLRYKLLEIDQKEYGYTWVPYMPLTAAGCRQLEYSMCITVEGYARPCAAILITNLNVRPSNKNGVTLAEVMKDPFIQKARNAYKQLEGKCGKCEYRETFCVGCRGIAFTYALRAGKEPNDAIIAEDPYCTKGGTSKIQTQYDLRC